MGSERRGRGDGGRRRPLPAAGDDANRGTSDFPIHAGGRCCQSSATQSTVYLPRWRHRFHADVRLYSDDESQQARKRKMATSAPRDASLDSVVARDRGLRALAGADRGDASSELEARTKRFPARNDTSSRSRISTASKLSRTLFATSRW